MPIYPVYEGPDCVCSESISDGVMPTLTISGSVEFTGDLTFTRDSEYGEIEIVGAPFEAKATSVYTQELTLEEAYVSVPILGQGGSTLNLVSGDVSIRESTFHRLTTSSSYVGQITFDFTDNTTLSFSRGVFISSSDAWSMRVTGDRPPVPEEYWALEVDTGFEMSDPTSMTWDTEQYYNNDTTTSVFQEKMALVLQGGASLSDPNNLLLGSNTDVDLKIFDMVVVEAGSFWAIDSTAPGIAVGTIHVEEAGSFVIPSGTTAYTNYLTQPDFTSTGTITGPGTLYIHIRTDVDLAITKYAAPYSFGTLVLEIPFGEPYGLCGGDVVFKPTAAAFGFPLWQSITSAGDMSLDTSEYSPVNMFMMQLNGAVLTTRQDLTWGQAGDVFQNDLRVSTGISTTDVAIYGGSGGLNRPWVTLDSEFQTITCSGDSHFRIQDGSKAEGLILGATYQGGKVYLGGLVPGGELTLGDGGLDLDSSTWDNAGVVVGAESISWEGDIKMALPANKLVWLGGSYINFSGNTHWELPDGFDEVSTEVTIDGNARLSPYTGSTSNWYLTEDILGTPGVDSLNLDGDVTVSCCRIEDVSKSGAGLLIIRCDPPALLLLSQNTENTPMSTYGVSHKIQYYAFDRANGTGDTSAPSTHTLTWIKDGVASTPTNSPVRVDATDAPGVYSLTLTDAECECESGTLAGYSSNSDVTIFPSHIGFVRLPDSTPGSNGGLPTVNSSNQVSGIASSVSVSTIGSGALTDIAETVLSTGVSTVEDTADVDSLCFVVLAAGRSKVEAGTLTVYQTDQITTFDTRSILSDSGSDPITSVGL